MSNVLAELQQKNQELTHQLNVMIATKNSLEKSVLELTQQVIGIRANAMMLEAALKQIGEKQEAPNTAKEEPKPLKKKES